MTERGFIRIGFYQCITAYPLEHNLYILKGKAGIEYGSTTSLFERLQRHELDIALLPPTAIFKNPKLEILPGVAVVTEKDAHTFRLCTNKLPDAIQNILIDDRAALAMDFLNLMIPRLLMLHPQITMSKMNIPYNYNFAASPYDAFVLAEEDAIKCDYNFTMSWDLGEAWRKYSNLPFVRFVFVTQPDIDYAKIEETFSKLSSLGQKSLDESIHNASHKYQIDEAFMRSFFTNNIRLTLDAKAVASLKTLSREMALAGITKGQIPLRIYQA